MAEYTSKISELNPLNGGNMAGVVPLSLTLASGELVTNKITLSQIRDLFDFSNAYDDVTAGIAGTVEGQIFYVFVDANKLSVNEYVRTSTGASAVIGSSGTKKVIYIPALLKHVQIQVDSFSQISSVQPSFEGQVIYLRGYYPGNSRGSGHFKAIINSTVENDLGAHVRYDAQWVWQRIPDKGTFSVYDFGAKGDGVTDDYFAFQGATYGVYQFGGGIINVPSPDVAFRITFPVFFFHKTKMVGQGMGSKIVFENPLLSAKGRGGFVMGSSREANRVKGMAVWRSGTVTGGNVADNTFVNPGQKQYLRDNQNMAQCTNCSISSLYLVAIYTGSNLNGGYGINLNNAMDIEIENIYGEGWTEMVNVGSDTIPETPSCYRVNVKNLYCLNPNQDKTFYSLVFVANSTDVTVDTAIQYKPLKDGTLNGSGLATNLCEDVTFTNIQINNLGRSASSEGVLINNTKGCIVRGLYVNNAKNGLSTFYSDASFNDAAKPNIFSDIEVNNSDNGISIAGKYGIFSDLKVNNVVYDVYFRTSNAQFNVLKFKPQKPFYRETQTPFGFFQNNTIRGYKISYLHFTPTAYLITPAADLLRSDGRFIATGVNDVIMRIPIPSHVNGVVDVRAFLTFNKNSLAGNTNGPTSFSMTLRRLPSWDGNIGNPMFMELTNSKTSAVDNTMNPQDTTLVCQPSSNTATSSAEAYANGYVTMRGSANGMDNALELLVTMTNNVNNNYIKEIRVGILVDE